MKTKLALIVMALSLFFCMNAQAGDQKGSPTIYKSSTIFKPGKDWDDDRGRGRGKGKGKDGGHHGGGKPPVTMPEISADSAALGLALIGGVLLLTAERSRARRA